MTRSGPHSRSFPKAARLLRRAQFLAVQQHGRNFAEGPVVARWVPREGGDEAAGHARVGFAVSARMGNAVVRNRIKRRLREAVRHERSSLPAVDIVLVARAAAREAGVAELRAFVRRLASRAGALRCT